MINFIFKKQENLINSGMSFLPREEIDKLLSMYPHEYKWREIHYKIHSQMKSSKQICCLAFIVAIINLLASFTFNQNYLLHTLISIIVMLISIAEALTIYNCYKRITKKLPLKIKKRIDMFDTDFINRLIEQAQRLKDKHLNIETFNP